MSPSHSTSACSLCGPPPSLGPSPAQWCSGLSCCLLQQVSRRGPSLRLGPLLCDTGRCWEAVPTPGVGSGIGGICQRPCSWAPGGAASLPPPCLRILSLLFPGLLTLAPSFLDFMGPLDTWAAPSRPGCSPHRAPIAAPEGRGGCRVPRATLSHLSPPPLLPQSPLGTSSRSEGPPPTEVNVCPPVHWPGGGGTN